MYKNKERTKERKARM